MTERYLRYLLGTLQMTGGSTERGTTQGTSQPKPPLLPHFRLWGCGEGFPGSSRSEVPQDCRTGAGRLPIPHTRTLVALPHPPREPGPAPASPVGCSRASQPSLPSVAHLREARKRQIYPLINPDRLHRLD